MPGAGHGAGQRRSHRRQIGARRPSRSSACRCGNGCCASPPTPSGLLDDLDTVDWSESIKEMQRNWIGRSEGAEVDFAMLTRPVDGRRSNDPRLHDPARHALRRDLHGARPRSIRWSTTITTPEQRDAVEAYQAEAARKSDLERTELAKKKTGVFTGAYAINPVNGEKIPIWIADYVLASYGTGAIMAVPAHDERDFEFAEQFRPADRPRRAAAGRLERRQQAYLRDERATSRSTGRGQLGPRRPADRRGQSRRSPPGWRRKGSARDESTTSCATGCSAGSATGASRSRSCTSWTPAASRPASSSRCRPTSCRCACRSWRTTSRPAGPSRRWARRPTGCTSTRDGKRYRRETNTMPQWAGSCWYYLRYIDPQNDKAFCDPAKAKYWMPVDLYVGGAEHAVLHLLYSRFWHKVLFDRGHVPTPEPFQRLVNQGMILGEMEFTGFRDRRPMGLGSQVEFDGDVDDREERRTIESSARRGQVEKQGDDFVLKDDPTSASTPAPTRCRRPAATSSTPTTSSSEYGADSLRLYEMFMGPLEAAKPWSMRGVEGVYRFLSRVWRLVHRRPRRGR